MASYLITGTSRGLGLSLASHLAAKPTNEVSKVIATSRNKPPTELQKIIDESDGRVVWIALDMLDKESIKRAVTEAEKVLGDAGLDILINNGAIAKYQPEGGVDYMCVYSSIQSFAASDNAIRDDLEEQFSVNVAGTHNVTRAFIPLLKKGTLRKIIFM
jgi:NAD(P)-dependent dehydrogenase (short-subunit alcohol dehydrogenase family)